MQKFIRIALPCVCFAVMVWFLLSDDIKYLDWTWLVLQVSVQFVLPCCV